MKILVQTIKIKLLNKAKLASLYDIDFNEILVGSRLTFSLKLFGFIFSYIFNIILARLFGVRILGIYALTLSVYSIVSLFPQMGSETSIVRFIAQCRCKKDALNIYLKILSLIVPLSVIFGSIFFLSSHWIAINIFHDTKLFVPFRITAFFLPFSALLALNTGALRGLKKIKEAFIFTTIFPPVFNTIGVLVLTFFIGRNYLAPIYANWLLISVSAIFSLFLWYKNVNVKSQEGHCGNNIERIKIKEIITTSIPMCLTSGILLFMNWSGNIFLGIFRNANESGIYHIALKISLFLSFTLGAVNSIAAPKFATIYWAGEYDKLKKIVKFSSNIIFIFTLPIFIIIILLARHIMNIFGEDFVLGYTTLIILSFGQMVNASCGSVGYLLNMSGHETKVSNALLLGLISNIILNFILVPMYGLIGAAIATSFSTIVWNLSASLYAYRIFGYWPGFQLTKDKLNNGKN